MISVAQSVQFLVFLSTLALVTALDDFMPVVFMNGLNVIRCSDKQVQIYDLPPGFSDSFDVVLTCGNRNEIFDGKFTEFKWLNFHVNCLPADNEIEEQQFVQTGSVQGDVKQFPETAVQITGLPGAKEATTTHLDAKLGKIEVKTPMNNPHYYTETEEGKKRIIYVLFPDYKLICVITSPSHVDAPCPRLHDINVTTIEHSCYYTPHFDHSPTIAEMQAEFAQLLKLKKPDPAQSSYLIDLPIPVRTNVRETDLRSLAFVSESNRP